MKARINNLVERNGWYYFRSRIPYHNSKKEVRLSLKTQDLQNAVTRCKFISTRLKEFSTYRGNAMIDREVMEQRIRKVLPSNSPTHSNFTVESNLAKEHVISGGVRIMPGPDSDSAGLDILSQNAKIISCFLFLLKAAV